MSVEVHDRKHLSQRFDISLTTIYVGYAPAGTLASQAKWTIARTSLDATGNPTQTLWTEYGVATWDNRTSETYK